MIKFGKFEKKMDYPICYSRTSGFDSFRTGIGYGIHLKI
jgi:hypothetical protein